MDAVHGHRAVAAAAGGHTLLESVAGRAAKGRKLLVDTLSRLGVGSGPEQTVEGPAAVRPRTPGTG